MKLVYLANSTIPSRAANSIHVMKMSQAFSKNGHEVTLVVPNKPDKENEVDNVYSYYDVEPCFEIEKVSRPQLSSAGTFVSNYLMGRKAAQDNPDVVYGRTVLGCYFASRRGLKTAFESHGPINQGRFGHIQEFFFKRLTNKAQFSNLVVISDALREYYIEQYPHLTESIFVARDGADPVNDSIQPIEFENPNERLQVGYIGHLYQGRGMDIIAKMARRCQWADFHIIGGEQEDVQSWRERLDGVDNITFYGFLPPNELDPYRLAFDVQVAPYQRDLETRGGRNTVDWMSPLKIFEYMATGRAILASNLPAIREILEHEETALLCSPEEPDDWIDALSRLRERPVFRSSLGERAKDKFTTNYTWKVRAEMILSKLS